MVFHSFREVIWHSLVKSGPMQGWMLVDLFGFQKIKLVCFPIEQTGYVLKVMKLQSLFEKKKP